MLQSSSAPVRPSLVLPVLAGIVAIAIFVVDTVTPLDIAIAVLYVAVVLLAMDVGGQGGVVLVGAGGGWRGGRGGGAAAALARPRRPPVRRRRLRGVDGAELHHHP